MKRFEITGGNGRGASLDHIACAIRQAGGNRVSRRNAYGWSNQPYCVTFAAQDESAASLICENAADILWPGDGSCAAVLLAWEYAQ